MPESFPELAQAVLEHAQPDRIDVVRAKRNLLGQLSDGQPHPTSALIASVATLLGAERLGHPPVALPSRDSVKTLITAVHPVPAAIRADLTAREALAELAAADLATGLDLAHYAETSRLAAVHSEASASVHQPVSFYLPADLADTAEQMRAQAVRDVIAARNKLRREADQRFPGDEEQQILWFSTQLTRRGLPHQVRQVPRGAIARMAIDRWARRPLEQVAADAVEYAAKVHAQAHRARRDMRKLQA